MARRMLPALVLLSVCAQPASAQSFFDQFVDPTDGYFDLSGWFAKKGAFLPVPIIISEPAVGAGAGLAAVWFHGKEAREDDPWAEPPKDAKPPPPSVSVLAGLGTSNGTRAAAGGHLGIWREDTVRYIGFGVAANANLEFYTDSTPRKFNIEGEILLQDLRLRCGDTPFFVGARYQLSTTETRFSGGNVPTPIGPTQLDSRNAGVGAVVSYDDRDNLFTPTRGTTAQMIFSFFDESVGGDFHYQQLELKAAHFRPLDDGERFFLGMRASGAVVDREAPFYAKPYIQLRGVPALRYQGDQVISTESELRWAVTPRWSAVGFFGLGGARYERDISEDSGVVVAGGVGFRYLMARVLGIHTGVDLAFGDEGAVLYLTMGSGL